MYAALLETEETELGLECCYRTSSQLRNPRELTAREKQNHRSRYKRRGTPKLRTPGGMYQRRNKSYAF